MPNRFLKESIKRSPQIDKLSWFEEVLFYRLIVTADDYGRYYANPVILRNDLFPTKDSITKKSIEDALAKLSAVNLLTIYEVDGEKFLSLTTWREHQTVRAVKSKFPTPENICKQMFSSACNSQTNENKCDRIRIRNSYSYSERENAPAHEKKAYGEFSNVYLTDEEYTALKEKAPDADARIEEFSAKLKAKGYKYENHYAAIVLWIAQDKEKTKQGKQEVASSFDPDEVLKARLSQTYSSFDADEFFNAALSKTYNTQDSLTNTQNHSQHKGATQ